METTKKKSIDEWFKESEALIEEGKQFLLSQGKGIDLGEWITIKNYVKRFGLSGENVVTNWIRRGIIPAENVMIIEELNGIRLIKAVPYKEATGA